MKSEDIVVREWLRARFHVLELAAVLDRLDASAQRESPSALEDERIAALRRAIGELSVIDAAQGRTERILRTYSEMAEPTI